MELGRLLILDDDPAIGRTIEQIARGAGLEARFTDDPAAFFDAVNAWDPTHIAIDLVMPRMDGVEVLTRLAKRGSRARIIITSGVDHRVLDAAGRSAVEHGLEIAGVLSKPFSAKALRSLLQTAPPAAGPGGSATRIAAGSGQVSVEDLRAAIERCELRLVFQPQVDCASGILAGFEALVRWQHPQHGLILPEQFVPLAETHGLIDALTEQVTEQALAWFATTFGAATARAAGQDAPSLAMNLSARTLKDESFVERILARCDAFGVAPEQLIFELTETSAMEDPVKSLNVLTRLRMKGFQLSIDDFGTGFSSMLQLVRLPFSEIKVDKSFVMTASRSEESRTVVQSIVELGHSLGLRSIAEGVEDAATLAYLRDIGCDLAQGYHIARPMSGEAVAGWLAQRRRRGGTG